MPFSVQSEDRTVQGSNRRDYYDETESVLSPPIDSQKSQPEVAEKTVAEKRPSMLANMKSLSDLSNNEEGDEDDYSDDAEF